MTPCLLVNKAVRESLIGELFPDHPSGSASLQATLKLSSSPSSLKTFALFCPHFASFCLIRLYPLSSASLSLSVSLILFFMRSFILGSLL